MSSIQRTASALTLVSSLLLLSACGEQEHAGPPVPTGGAPYPDSLSAWNLLQVRNGHLQLQGDTLAYELGTPLFSDYAMKLRTVTLPDGSAAKFDGDDSFDFPVGTVISKTFYYPRQADTLLMSEAESAGFDGTGLDLDQVHLVETRLLIHEPSGWHALPYIWDADQREASLQITGAIQRLSLLDEHGNTHGFPYVVPNRNECAGCHAVDQANNRLQPLGPKARHLNRNISWYPNGTANQLLYWAESGRLDGLPSDISNLPADPVWQAGATDDLDQRARAWLDVNCGHCHQPGASADTSALFLHAQETSMIRMGRCKPPVAAGRGTGGNRFSIVPGEPENSILVYRLTSTDPGVMMPELGRSLVHHSSVALISQWIAQLPGDC